MTKAATKTARKTHFVHFQKLCRLIRVIDSVQSNLIQPSLLVYEGEQEFTLKRAKPSGACRRRLRQFVLHRQNRQRSELRQNARGRPAVFRSEDSKVSPGPV